MLKIEDIVRRIIPTLFAAALLIGCGEREPQAAPDAEAAAAAEPAQEAVAEPYRLEQTLYRGGDIVTMAPGGPETAEAVVQREGRIVFVGSEAEAMERFEGKADIVDLAGNTLLPGFIDAHGHLKGVGLQAVVADAAAAIHAAASFGETAGI